MANHTKKPSPVFKKETEFHSQWRLQIFFFSGLLLKNLNYKKFNKNIASYINQKKKKKHLNT